MCQNYQLLMFALFLSTSPECNTHWIQKLEAGDHIWDSPLPNRNRKHESDIPFAFGTPDGIIGGEPLPPGIHPFLVSVGVNGFGHVCGASLISSRVVLSAGRKLLLNVY